MTADKLPDFVLPFEVKPLGIRGRVVRLGPVIDDILSRHDYPPSVSALLAQGVALTALLGSAMKFDGKFILQTKTDGPVSMLVADYVAPNGVRGTARFTKEQTLEGLGEKELLGAGYLAMTVDQGANMERYQGIVPLGDNTLAEAAHTYFMQSEQIPTRLRLAAGPLSLKGDKAAHWRAGAILIQHLPREGGMSPIQYSSGDVPEGYDDTVTEHDDWVKAKLLLDTVEDHELLDPTLSAEELLYRLYHEDGVTVYPAAQLARHCTCSAAAVETMLKNFTAEERAGMVQDGEIAVTCEFCSTRYTFSPSQFD
ncbi:Hsp33 family molecular chaperone [Aestuariivirga sp.]|uniref:Hsp33 family molecular chaperone n=1 Tax=Aestuariivirga sp. TaxID=2650926 RepID=UPI0039E40747